METKSYYQPNGGFKLENSIYKKTVYTIRSYYIFKKRIEDIENKSEIDITENDILNKERAQFYVSAIEEALSTYVAPNYREAVFVDPLLFYSNVCGNVEQEYSREELDSTLKKAIQI